LVPTIRGCRSSGGIGLDNLRRVEGRLDLEENLGYHEEMSKENDKSHMTVALTSTLPSSSEASKDSEASFMISML